jgi:hypothetical protein
LELIGFKQVPVFLMEKIDATKEKLIELRP